MMASRFTRLHFRIPILPALLLLACETPASLQPDGDLIPRERFFTFEERMGLRADPTLDHLYFRSDRSSDALFRIATARPREIDTLCFGGALRTWWPTSKGVLVGWADDQGSHLEERSSAGDRVFTLPDGASALRVLAAASMGGERYMIEITTPDEATSGLHVLDPATGKFERHHGLQPAQNLFFDGDLHLIAGTTSSADGGNTLLLFEEARAGWDTLRVHPWTVDQFMGGFSRIISVSRDGNSIYFTSNRDTDKSRLFRYDRATRATQELAADDRGDLLPFGISLDAANRPTSIVALYARTIRHVVDPSWEPDLRFLEGRIKGDLSFVASSSDDQRWVVRELSGGPSRILLFDRRTRTLTFLLTEQGLQEEELASRHAFAVKSFDGVELPVHVYLPQGSDPDGDGIPDAPLPTVLYVHGGPWVGIGQWNQSFFWRNFQLLADRGYAVINCEFRGSCGLGKAMIDKGDKKWRTGMVEDHASIARWAIQQRIARPGRLALWGWSFGGYSAMAAVAFHPELYAAGIAMYGISDQVSFARTPFASNSFWHERVGDPDVPADLKTLQEGSPLLHIDAIKAPLFLTTGARDDRIPQEQMDRMADALEAAGKEVIYSVYPEEGHDYMAPDSWISFWAGAENFLAKHLGGRALRAGDDLHKGGVQWVKGEALLTP